MLLFVLCLGFMLALYWVLKYADSISRSKTYIYPGNRHLYYVIYTGKLKNPSTGDWHEAIIYRGLNDNKIYARDLADFRDKFIPIQEWKS